MHIAYANLTSGHSKCSLFLHFVVAIICGVRQYNWKNNVSMEILTSSYACMFAQIVVAAASSPTYLHSFGILFSNMNNSVLFARYSSRPKLNRLPNELLIYKSTKLLQAILKTEICTNNEVRIFIRICSNLHLMQLAHATHARVLGVGSDLCFSRFCIVPKKKSVWIRTGKYACAGNRRNVSSNTLTCVILSLLIIMTDTVWW